MLQICFISTEPEVELLIMELFMILDYLTFTTTIIVYPIAVIIYRSFVSNIQLSFEQETYRPINFSSLSPNNVQHVKPTSFVRSPIQGFRTRFKLVSYWCLISLKSRYQHISYRLKLNLGILSFRYFHNNVLSMYTVFQ